jgi:hypothetical protein
MEDVRMTALTPSLSRELDATSIGTPTAEDISKRTAVAPQARPRIVGRTGLAVKITIGVIAPLICLLAALGGIGSFATIRQLAIPWFGAAAWIVPVGIDVGILAILASDLLIEYLGFPWPVLRWVAWAFIGATVYLNIAAAQGNLTAAVMHAAMPTLFVTVIEGIRYLLRQLTGLAKGTRIERIPASRWLLAPRSSFLLARRMVLWQVTSYQQGLALEYQRLQAVARLQETHGQYLWRWKAPLSERLALRLASAGSGTNFKPVGSAYAVSAIEPAAPEPPTEKLRSLLPQQCLIEPPKPINTPNDRDRLLITTATEILRDASRQGTRLTQAALARRLRAQGHAIANDRLRWLITQIDGQDDVRSDRAMRQEQGASA